jgi:peptidoglycan/xylan/chitin deacetylase (PgdA/CDA1 family)
MKNNKILIVNFHGLGDPPAECKPCDRHLWVEPHVFESMLDTVAEHAGMCITFDDGNASDYDVALAALTKRNLTAQFFIVCNRLNDPRSLTDWQVRALAEAGMEIGLHGLRHVSWRGIPRAELATQIGQARDQLEELLDAPVKTVACPFGAYDRCVLQVLRSLGFTRVYTSDRGHAATNAWLQPRNTVHREDRPADIVGWHDNCHSALQTLVRKAKLTYKRLR